jgi:hypothetical protein
MATPDTETPPEETQEAPMFFGRKVEALEHIAFIVIGLAIVLAFGFAIASLISMS